MAASAIPSLTPAPLIPLRRLQAPGTGPIQRPEAIDHFLRRCLRRQAISRTGSFPAAMSRAPRLAAADAGLSSRRFRALVPCVRLDLIRDWTGHLRVLGRQPAAAPSGVAYSWKTGGDEADCSEALFAEPTVQTRIRTDYRLHCSRPCSSSPLDRQTPRWCCSRQGLFKQRLLSSTVSWPQQMGIQLVEGRDLVCEEQPGLEAAAPAAWRLVDVTTGASTTISLTQPCSAPGFDAGGARADGGLTGRRPVAIANCPRHRVARPTS